MNFWLKTRGVQAGILLLVMVLVSSTQVQAVDIFDALKSGAKPKESTDQVRDQEEPATEPVAPQIQTESSEPVETQAGTQALKGGHVTATVGLNVRTGPSVRYRKIGVLRYGTEIVILAEKNNWYQINYKGGTGWVCGRYVRTAQKTSEKEPETPPLDQGSSTGFVTAAGLNVRTGPGVSNSRFHVLTRGAKVNIVGEKNGWYLVQFGNSQGWVSGKYISLGSAPPGGTKDGDTVTDKDYKPKDPQITQGKVYVDVLQRTQFDPANGKYQNSWCGPTSLSMVYDYYGRKESTRDVANRIYDFKGRTGTYVGDIVKDAKSHGFPNTTLKNNVDFNYLEQNLKQGKPVIVGVEVAWKNGHYMVVVGMEGNKVIVNDPGRRAVRREFSKSWFLTQWNGRNRRSIVLK